MLKLFVFVGLLLTCVVTSAQIRDTILTSKTTKTLEVNEKTIVKDSLGNVIPYTTWMNGIMKGTHLILPNFTKDGEFIYRSTSSTDFKFSKVNNPNKNVAVKPSTYFETNTAFDFFRAKTLDGFKVNEKTLANKIIVINFWFTNCGPCKLEIPDLNAIVSKYKNNNDIVFFSVALDDEQALNTFFEKFPFKYAHIANGQYIADKYGVKSYPTHLIVDKKGIIKFHTTGLSSKTTEVLATTIEELLIAN